MAPNAPIGAACTIIRIIPKKILAIASMTPLIFSPRSPRRDIAKPVRIDISRTCKRSPLAKAPMNVSGMIASKWATMPSSFALLTYPATALGSRLATSMSKPLPGCSSSPTINPRASVSVGNGLEINQGFDAYAADFLEVAHRSDPVHHRAKDHRANHHLDERDEAVAKRLKGFAQIRPEMADQNAKRDRNQNLYV